eukprot:RCo034842
MQRTGMLGTTLKWREAGGGGGVNKSTWRHYTTSSRCIQHPLKPIFTHFSSTTLLTGQITKKQLSPSLPPFLRRLDILLHFPSISLPFCSLTFSPQKTLAWYVRMSARVHLPQHFDAAPSGLCRNSHSAR